METGVLLVDDHKILREGLKNIIDKHTHMQVIGEATNGREAIKKVADLEPDVVIMDVAMAGLNGIEATRQLLAEKPEVKVIGLSMHDNKRFIIGMFKAGAYGYLLKDCASEELITAIETVSRNQKYLTQRVSGIILNEFMESYNEESILSSREIEILQLIAEGKNSKQIAETLFLSSKTVDAHRKNIMDKLDIHTVPELTTYAIRQGIISID
jgi:DNA-binding NarL/FixJ family response regulator